jgi:hypothetical protein
VYRELLDRELLLRHYEVVAGQSAAWRLTAEGCGNAQWCRSQFAVIGERLINTHGYGDAQCAARRAVGERAIDKITERKGWAQDVPSAGRDQAQLGREAGVRFEVYVIGQRFQLGSREPADPRTRQNARTPFYSYYTRHGPSSTAWRNFHFSRRDSRASSPRCCGIVRGACRSPIAHLRTARLARLSATCMCPTSSPDVTACT